MDDHVYYLCALQILGTVYYEAKRWWKRREPKVDFQHINGMSVHHLHKTDFICLIFLLVARCFFSLSSSLLSTFIFTIYCASSSHAFIWFSSCALTAFIFICSFSENENDALVLFYFYFFPFAILFSFSIFLFACLAPLFFFFYSFLFSASLPLTLCLCVIFF